MSRKTSKRAPENTLLTFQKDLEYFKDNSIDQKLWITASSNSISDDQSLTGNKGGSSTLDFHPSLKSQIYEPIITQLKNRMLSIFRR